MRFDLEFLESNQGFTPQFEQVNNVSDGGYNKGYAKGYETGYKEGLQVPTGLTSRRPENLHNTQTDTQNVYLENGEETSYNKWTTTDYIPVIAGRYYEFVGGSVEGRYCGYYDSEKKYVSECPDLNADGTNMMLFFEIPEQVAYIRLSAYYTNMRTVAIYACEGSPVAVN